MDEIGPSAQLPTSINIEDIEMQEGETEGNETEENAGEDHAWLGVPRPEQTNPTARRTLRIVFGVSSYALAIPFYLARRFVRSSPVQWASHEITSLLGLTFDTAVAIALTRLQDNPDLQSFVTTTIQRQLGPLGNDAAVAAIVQTQAERLVIALGQDPAPLLPLVQNVADNYIRSILADPTLVNDLVQSVAGDYLVDLQAHPNSMDDLVQALGDQYINYLHLHPETLDPFVEQVALRLMEQLRANPEELHGLVQEVGDSYIAYLRTSPEGVQELLQGHSQTLANRVVDEVRDRSETADQSLESLVRSILGGRFTRGPNRGTA